MTEQEWMDCTDPQPMLEFLRGKVSDRKLRLYFCGGCRLIACLFFRPESLKCVEVAERYADGKATGEEVYQVQYDAESPTFGYEFDKEGFPADHPYKQQIVPRLVEMGALPESALTGGEWQVDDAVRERLLAAGSWLAMSCAHSLREASPLDLRAMSIVPWPGRCLIDCAFGNPFRPIPLDSSWLTSPTPQLAESIYTDRAFDRLPILADALEDAGCTNADILNHCRQPGEHVRGCWVIDLLLGKK